VTVSPAPRTVDAEVVIVGAGPAGTATAWALARVGVDVVVLDRARFPRDKPCAEYLSPQASRVLSDMGVLASIEAAGAAQLTGMTIRAPSGAWFRGEFAAGHGFRGFRDQGLALRRRVLDAILLRHAESAGARVVEGAAVTDLTRDPAGRVTGVRYTRREDAPEPVRAGGGVAADGAGDVLSARVVVGADGLRSVISRRLGLAHTRRWPRRVAFVTHYRGVADMGTVGEMHVERDGYVGLADVGGGETNVAVVVPAHATHGIGADRAGFLESWIARRPQLVPRFRGASRVSPVRAIGPFAQHARRAWSPGAALVGDAADFFDPFTGEGIYAALRGAELLTPSLYDAARAPNARTADAALAAYDRCRRHEFRGKWIVERAVGTAVAMPAIIEHVVRVLARRPDMADLLIGVTGDFVPPREVLRLRYLGGFVLPDFLSRRLNLL
jgi:menaquinone-9 beta-reductase